LKFLREIGACLLHYFAVDSTADWLSRSVSSTSSAHSAGARERQRGMGSRVKHAR